jgi:hypothetical protein
MPWESKKKPITGLLIISESGVPQWFPVSRISQGLVVEAAGKRVFPIFEF